MDSRQSNSQQQQQHRRKFTPIGPPVKKCDLCSSSIGALYTCDRCQAAFCSVACFKCDQHSECAEHFYKQLLLKQLTSITTGKQEQAHFVTILKQNPTSSEEFDKAWFELSDDEKCKLIALINGLNDDRLFDTFLTEQWKPWWYFGKWEKSFLTDEKEEKEIFNDADNNTDQEMSSEEQGDTLFPQVYPDLERIIKLTSKKILWPSTIPACLLSTVFAYCHLFRLYHGEISCLGSSSSSGTEESDPELEKWLPELGRKLFLLCHGEISCQAPSFGAEDSEPEPELEKWLPELGRELFRLCPFLVETGLPPKSPPPETFQQALDASLGALFASEGPAQFFGPKLTAIELLQDLKVLFDFRAKNRPGRLLSVQLEVSAEDAKQAPSVLQAPKALVLALSDLIHILHRVQLALAKCSDANQEESQKRHESKRIDLARETLISYVIWAVQLGCDALQPPIVDGLMQAIDVEIEKLKQENLRFEQTALPT